jgi:voltage-gated potassium channel
MSDNPVMRRPFLWARTVARLPTRFRVLLAVPLALLLVGTLGYRLIEGDTWTWIDALYMTVITVTTVGYGETHPLSQPGRVFTIFLCLGGIFTLFYAASEFIRAVISGELQTLLGKQRMERKLAELHDHVIVCGYGRMGRLVSQEFEALKLRHVVIERNAERLAEFHSRHGIPLHGDATSDAVLKTAGIERARALVTLTTSDADNLFITLSSRLLNDKLFLVARAEDAEAEVKLRKVGANQVVSPTIIGGFRVAHAVLRPTVVDFVERALRRENLELQIEEVPISPGSMLCGKTLKDSRLRQELELIVLAIKRASGELHSTPPGEMVLEDRDILIVLGHTEQLEQLRILAGGPGDGA